MHAIHIRTLIRRVAIVTFGASASLANIAAHADDCAVVASGLRAPIGSVLTEEGDLLVSETGTLNVPNSGRISIVSPDGTRRTLLDGLPQGTNAAGGDASGPNSLTLRGRTVYVAIGQGDTVILGPMMGTWLPNPDVSSPIFSAILAIHLSSAAERQTKGFQLTEQQQMRLAGGETVTLSNGGGDRISIEVVVDFPDYESDPLPDLPANVRNSNPFGVLAGENNLFVTNGGLNRLVKVDLASGTYATLASFDRIQNLAGAAGPPSVEPVPTGISQVHGELLVSLFSGAPFLPGVSRIKTVDRTSGDQSDFITGLRTAIGVLPLRNGSDIDYLVLENNFAPVPGFPPTGAAIKRFETPTSTPTKVNQCTLDRPTSMSLDQSSGTIYVTELLRGTVVKVPFD
ncbi:ScyD/ScyE family protein [Steroidobacter flavus]|uniref:ScyD/ScyE family protein n=1 Tax=Steroidobacter flavus TaxID=1842136 RepID=A0ABV8SJM9_9GAMM